MSTTHRSRHSRLIGRRWRSYYTGRETESAGVRIPYRRQVHASYYRVSERAKGSGRSWYGKVLRFGLVRVKSSVPLTDEQYAFAKELVRSGRYASVSAVIQQGIDLLKQRMQDEVLESKALRQVPSRRRSGNFVGADEMDVRLNKMISDKRRAHGVSC